MLIAFLAAAAIDPAAFTALVEADRRLVTIGRRLAKSGAGLCAGVVSNPGWTIADVEQYRPDMRASVRATLGIGDLPTVIALEPGSAAARAGLRRGDAVVGIGSVRFGVAASPKPSRARQFAFEKATALALGQGSAQVSIIRGGEATTLSVSAEPGCRSDFVISRSTGLRGASSSGTQVGVSADIVDYAASDDELALILAHELAHNILGHNESAPPTRASGEDRSGRSKRSREAEADRWALYLMARAGYDVTAAPGFWRRWGPKTSFGIFNAPSHPSWRERAMRAETEIVRIQGQRAAGQTPIP